jgi:enoyl-CoA hydratase/carnithine racemase
VVITLLSHVLKTDVLSELQSVVRAITADKLIITGTNGYFAAGADISELNSLSAVEALDFSRRGQALMDAISGHRAMSIAAIDGFCMGGGLDIALACDRRYATPKSILAHPGGRLGTITGWGGTQHLPQIVGKSRALDIMITGRPLKAAEALDWRLIDGVVDDPVEYGLNF